MNIEILLLVLVGVTALAIILQGFSIWWASRSITLLADRLENQVGEFGSKLNIVQTRLVEVSENLKPLRTAAEEASTSFNEISSILKQRASDLDSFVGDLLSVGRNQVSKIDYLVTDTVQKFEQTTEIIQQDMIRPAVEISSFVKGIRAGLGVLFSSQKPTRSKDMASDEELFIG